MNRTIEDIQKDIELLGIKGGYDIEQLLTPQDCRRLSYEIERLKLELLGYRQAILQDKEMLGLKQENERLHSIIKEVRELANKEDFTMKQKYEMREELLEILDKENNVRDNNRNAEGKYKV